MTPMTSTKPYLFKAILEWIEDNDLTPHVVVDAYINETLVPQEYVKDGQITLNISSASIELYQLDNKALHFSARFNGVSQEIFVPMNAILGVYARENGQGMFFDAEDYVEEDVTLDSKPTQTESDVANNKKAKADEVKFEPRKVDSTNLNKSAKKGRPRSDKAKRDKSHLKIIK